MTVADDDLQVRVAKLKEALSQRFPAGRFKTELADRIPYGTDNSRLRSVPDLLLLPVDHDEVVEAVRLAHEQRVPVTARGRATGTTGAAVPVDGGLSLSFERMDRILEISPEDRYAVVQPGVTNGDLQRAAGEHGLFWPPDPTSADYCSIGGNLACNAAGPRAVKYGTPRDNTLGLRAVTGTGDPIRTGCYTTKGVVGYDLTRLLIGSEGTLAVITEAVLKLTPMPSGVRTLRAVYDDMTSAAAAVSRVMGQPHTPRVLEFMDGASIEMVREHARVDLPTGAAAMLMLEVDGDGPGLDAAEAAVDRALDGAGLLEKRRAADAAEAKLLWAARKALSPSLRNVAPKKVNEDVVVPVSRMAELIAGLRELGDQHDITIVNFGHAGNGNIHVNLMFDPEEPGATERAERCLDAVFRLVLELRGTLSGEHGVGVAKAAHVGLELDAPTLSAMRAIKAALDPEGILNPGKMFPVDA